MNEKSHNFLRNTNNVLNYSPMAIKKWLNSFNWIDIQK